MEIHTVLRVIFQKRLFSSCHIVHFGCAAHFGFCSKQGNVSENRFAENRKKISSETSAAYRLSSSFCFCSNRGLFRIEPKKVSIETGAPYRHNLPGDAVIKYKLRSLLSSQALLSLYQCCFFTFRFAL
jgi:hypothetical protein